MYILPRCFLCIMLSSIHQKTIVKPWITILMIYICTHTCDIIFTTKECNTSKSHVIDPMCTVDYFTEVVNIRFAKIPLKFTILVGLPNSALRTEQHATPLVRVGVANHAKIVVNSYNYILFTTDTTPAVTISLFVTATATTTALLLLLQLVVAVAWLLLLSLIRILLHENMSQINAHNPIERPSRQFKNSFLELILLQDFKLLARYLHHSNHRASRHSLTK